MFEKLLLAAGITFSLNLFIGISVQPIRSTESAQFTKQQTVMASTHPSVYLAKAQDDRPSLWSLFQ